MGAVKTMMANHIEMFEDKCLKKIFNGLYIALLISGCLESKETVFKSEKILQKGY